MPVDRCRSGLCAVGMSGKRASVEMARFLLSCWDVRLPAGFLIWGSVNQGLLPLSAHC